MQKEYSLRRARVAKELKRSAGLVFAGNADAHLESSWRPHAHFEYLTGITNESGAVLLLDPAHSVASRREILLLPARDLEKEQWDGLRQSIGSALRNETGFATIMRTSALPMLLKERTSFFRLEF